MGELFHNLIQLISCKLGNHSWGAWTYISPGSCAQVRVCIRRDAQENRQAEHDWGEWKSESACRDVMICNRDGEKDYQQHHSWGEMQRGGWNIAGKQICLLCGAESECSHPNLHSSDGYAGHEEYCEECGYMYWDGSYL